MTRGRPRTVLGTFGKIAVNDIGGGYRASTRHRDLDGRLRKVTATATSKKGAEPLLKGRLLDRTGYGSGGVLSLASPFPDLADLWLAYLELRDISEGTKDNYRDDLRLHVRPFFENYTLGDISTGRVEHFLKSERRISYSRAKHSRTVLNRLFTFALRHDSMPRNPVEGTSPLAKPKNQVRGKTTNTLLGAHGLRDSDLDWGVSASWRQALATLSKASWSRLMPPKLARVLIGMVPMTLISSSSRTAAG